LSGLIVGAALTSRGLSGAWSPAPVETQMRAEPSGAPPLEGVELAAPTSPALELDPGLFCRSCGDAKPVHELETSALPLRLLATLEANDPSESMATLVHLPTHAVSAYLPGEEVLPGVRLEAVQRGRAYLRNGERLEQLSIEKTGAIGGELPTAKDRTSNVSCEGQGPCRLSRAWVRALLQRPGELAKQARVVPFQRDGEVRGFKVYGVRPRSVWARLGVENGDLIETVNGARIDELDELMELYGDFEGRSEWVVGVRRRGEPIERRFVLE
jgi:general secretion pathway protein C